MTNERPEYRVLRAIADRDAPNRTAYLPGEYIHAQVVDDWGLTIGEDVEALRPESMARPAGNAKRAEWAAYAAAQGMEQDTVDSMTRDQLRAEYPADAADTPPDEAAADEQPPEVAAEAGTDEPGAEPAKGE